MGVRALIQIGLTSAIMALSMAIAGAADGGYFIAVGKTDPARAASYETFLAKVKPVWNRHGMHVVLRVKARYLMNAKAELTPDDITVLRYESRAQFNAYLADPDYQAIKQLRLNALPHLAIMEAQDVRRDGLAYLAKTPMALVSFDLQKPVADSPAFTLGVDLIGPVQGQMAAAWKGVTHVRFAPLSFDDNPMSDANAAGILTLAGDLIR